MTTSSLRATAILTVLAPLAFAACEVHRAEPGGAGRSVLDASHVAAITDSVRAFADDVARGVTRRGPVAWRDYFADTPAFFMASEGRLVFPSSDSATRGIQGLTAIISHIELRWGDSLRVDVLGPGLAVVAMPWREVQVDRAGHRVEEAGFFTGLAEHGAAGWQFRDAHWSVAVERSRP